MEKIRILSVGGFTGFGDSNTCVLRDKILQEFGTVDHVDTTRVPYNLRYRILNRLFRLGIPCRVPDLSNANVQILELANKEKYDLIWIDKGVTIYESTLKRLHELLPNAKIVGYSPDWMGGRHNQTKQFLESLKQYDCYATTKSYSVAELRGYGCSDVIFIGNSYQADFHKPYELTDDERNQYASDIGFIGSWEEERAESILYLGTNGLRIDVWGNGKWPELANKCKNIVYHGGDLMDERYCKVICGNKISLCFLRKNNKDLQTTRSVEIPACGAFMLAERTSEHLDLFEEGKEADYFSSNEELLEKCRYYLENESERIKIAQNGRLRCINSDYSNRGRIKQILDHVLS